jgi:nitrogen fixation NifU-like protein
MPVSHDHDIDEKRLSPRFIEHMRAPANLGEMDAPGGRAEMTGQCGDSIGVHIAVARDRLATVRVQPRGCVYTLVCASALSCLAQGRSLDEALCIEPEDLAVELGGLPEDHLHCARLAVNTLGEAIADYYRHHGNGRK